MNNIPETCYLTLSQIARETGIPVTTLRIKIHIGSKIGLEPPPRKRVGKHYLYDMSKFMQWLWQNAPALQRKFEFGVKAGDDVENVQ